MTKSSLKGPPIPPPGAFLPQFHSVEEGILLKITQPLITPPAPCRKAAMGCSPPGHQCERLCPTLGPALSSPWLQLSPGQLLYTYSFLFYVSRLVSLVCCCFF